MGDDAYADGLRDGLARNAVEKAATQAGAFYPEAVWRLVDPGSVQFGSDLQPANADAVVQDVMKAYPEAFNAGPAAQWLARRSSQPVAGRPSVDGGTRGPVADRGFDVGAALAKVKAATRIT